MSVVKCNSPTVNDAQTFPDNEVRKGELTMQLKKLRETQDHLVWPADSNDLPVISWDSFQKQAEARPLVAIAGFIHDLSDFMDEHPGGRHLLAKNLGKDATTAFFGGVYDHSNAAHNVSHYHQSAIRRSIHVLTSWKLFLVACYEACRCPSWRYAPRIRPGYPPFAKASHTTV